jgi:hypothetical protein
MKNFTAPKLLKLALSGSHLSFCPNVTNKILSVTECLCWKNEIRKWEARSSIRVRKARPTKVHNENVKCSAKLRSKTTQDLTEVTCQQCNKNASKVIKPKKSRAKKNLPSSLTAVGDLSLISAPIYWHN